MRKFGLCFFGGIVFDCGVLMGDRFVSAATEAKSDWKSSQSLMKKWVQMPGFLAWSVTQQKSVGEIYAITYDRYSKELFKELPKEGV